MTDINNIIGITTIYPRSFGVPMGAIQAALIAQVKDVIARLGDRQFQVRANAQKQLQNLRELDHFVVDGMVLRAYKQGTGDPEIDHRLLSYLRENGLLR